MSTSALPAGWTLAQLSELAAHEPNAITDGPFGSKLKTEHYQPSGPRVVRLQNIGDGAFVDERAHISASHFATLSRHRVSPGDLVIAALGEKLPRAALVPDSLGPAIVKADCIRFKVDAQVISAKYLLYALNSPQLRNQAQTIIHGVGRPRLNQGEIKALTVPVAPRAEQDRIVAEIEKQFTRLDAGVEALRRLQAHLRRYRAAVLKAACEGRLDLSASSDVPRAKARDSANLPALPASWRWAPFGSVLARIQSGKNFRCEERPPNAAEYGVVKVSAVTWGTFDSDESKTCLDDSRFDEDILIRPGDFLFSRANTIQLVGTCVIAGAVTRRLMLSDKILRFTIAGADPRWMMWMLRSPWGRAEIERLASGNQESMRNIGQDRIRQIRVPLPPVDEQVRLVRAIERYLSVADTATQAVEVALRRSARLRASILSEAFAGTLVSRDPSSSPVKVSA